MIGMFGILESNSGAIFTKSNIPGEKRIQERQPQSLQVLVQMKSNMDKSNDTIIDVHKTHFCILNMLTPTLITHRPNLLYNDFAKQIRYLKGYPKKVPQRRNGAEWRFSGTRLIYVRMHFYSMAKCDVLFSPLRQNKIKTHDGNLKITDGSYRDAEARSIPFLRNEIDPRTRDIEPPVHLRSKLLGLEQSSRCSESKMLPSLVLLRTASNPGQLRSYHLHIVDGRQILKFVRILLSLKHIS